MLDIFQQGIPNNLASGAYSNAACDSSASKGNKVVTASLDRHPPPQKFANVTEAGPAQRLVFFMQNLTLNFVDKLLDFAQTFASTRKTLVCERTRKMIATNAQCSTHGQLDHRAR